MSHLLNDLCKFYADLHNLGAFFGSGSESDK